MVVAHSDVAVGELAVVERMAEACPYSQVCRGQQRKHSDVSNDLTQISEVLPAHSLSADCSMEGRRVFVAGRDMQELQEEDAMSLDIAIDSM